MSDAIQLEVTLLGREYRIACHPEEKAELLAAVAHLDGKMREIRDASKITGAEKIAVMAGLNIAHELLRARGAGGFDSEDIRRRMIAMQVAIDQAIAEQN
jgi:cell division protein ZapA